MSSPRADTLAWAVHFLESLGPVLVWIYFPMPQALGASPFTSAAKTGKRYMHSHRKSPSNCGSHSAAQKFALWHAVRKERG